MRDVDVDAVVGFHAAESDSSRVAMADAPPQELTRLLRVTSAEGDSAWTAFLRAYSALLLHVARSATGCHDDAMDAYAFVIERLREQDHRRLRAYELHVRCTFTTWLVVVARRLCVDWHRARFGRSRGNTGGAELDEAQFRRRLAALAYEELDPALAGAPPDTAPDQQLQAAELHERLAAAVCGLTPEDQLLLRLRFEDGLSANEIAGVLQLASPFHVYRRLTHVLAVLRRELRARGIESPVP